MESAAAPIFQFRELWPGIASCRSCADAPSCTRCEITLRPPNVIFPHATYFNYISFMRPLGSFTLLRGSFIPIRHPRWQSCDKNTLSQKMAWILPGIERALMAVGIKKRERESNSPAPRDTVEISWWASSDDSLWEVQRNVWKMVKQDKGKYDWCLAAAVVQGAHFCMFDFHYVASLQSTKWQGHKVMTIKKKIRHQNK